MGDGAITIWDAKKILEGNNPDSAMKMGRGCVSA